MNKIQPVLAGTRIERGRKCLGHRTPYQLGAGGLGSWAPGKASDCSGFVSWLIETQRKPKPGRGFWIETTSIYHDAMDGQSAFVRLEKPEPGCMAVYGDYGTEEGHIGLVTDAVKTRRGWKVIGIDCGHGNWAHFGDAIREHELTYFEKNRRTIYVCLKQDLL